VRNRRLARQSIAAASSWRPSHAGKEKRGAAEADAGLFRGRTWALTPDLPSELATPAARDFRSWLERMGARIMVLDAEEHDRVSRSSRTCRNWHPPPWPPPWRRAWAIPRAGAWRPGLEDMTRLALGSYDLWRDILATNTEHIERALAVYIQKLSTCARTFGRGSFKRSSNAAPPWRAACGGPNEL